MRHLVTLTLILLLAACQQPDFLDTKGNGYRYEDMVGKWRIVNYWATWCGPCIKEIPELNVLAKDHAETVKVFGVNYDSPEIEERQAQVEKMKIEFPVYSEDPASALGIAKPEVLPTTFIFSPDGKLAATLVGPQTEATLLAEMN
jgi:thiol-disulfide isomerase/thioredoxin